MSQNKCWYHPTREVITTCEHCRKPLCIDCWWHFNKKAVIICEHCKRPLCLECSYHPCPKRENLARHVKFRDIDFRYIFLSVFLFLLGLGGFTIFVQLFDQVCNDFNESCVYLCADIYASCCLMGLGIAFAIKEIKAI
jgi:hypothetical protein